MAHGWVTVFTGVMPELLLKQGVLEANGIPTQLVDLDPNLADPFQTRATLFGANLQVPSDRVTAALEALDGSEPSPSRTPPRSAPRAWTTVFVGSMSEALVCQGLLESNDVPTHIVDENMKVIDPFVTGGSIFDVQLQVPEDRTVEAKEILDYRPPPASDDPLPDEPPPPDPFEERVRQLGKRIRWASLVTFTTPYALYLAWPYYVETKRLGRNPEGHAWTIAAIVYSALLVLALARIFLFR